MTPPHERHPNIPPTARQVATEIPLRDAAWWPCAQPDDEWAFMLSVSAHFLGFDQARSFWVQCLVESDSDFSCVTFVAWNKTARGFIAESQDAPLTLYAFERLYWFAAQAAKRHPILGELSTPQHRYIFADEDK